MTEIPCTDQTRALIQVQPSLIAEAIANLGVVPSHKAILESDSARRCESVLAITFFETNRLFQDENLVPTETLVGSSKLEKERVHPRKSTCLWLLRAPYWMTSRVLEISGMKTPFGWDWSFRTYNEVRWSSEIDYYFMQGKIKNLQDLFASGQLSPLFREQGSGRSLLHVSTIFVQGESYLGFSY